MLTASHERRNSHDWTRFLSSAVGFEIYLVCREFVLQSQQINTDRRLQDITGDIWKEGTPMALHESSLQSGPPKRRWQDSYFCLYHANCLNLLPVSGCVSRAPLWTVSSVLHLTGVKVTRTVAVTCKQEVNWSEFQQTFTFYVCSFIQWWLKIDNWKWLNVTLCKQAFKDPLWCYRENCFHEWVPVCIVHEDTWFTSCCRFHTVAPISSCCQ